MANFTLALQQAQKDRVTLASDIEALEGKCAALQKQAITIQSDLDIPGGREGIHNFDGWVSGAECHAR